MKNYMEKIEWFTDNYLENKEQCIFLLEKAEREYSFNTQQFYEGCFELRLGKTDKELLETHIKLLGNMANVGINAHIAGIKLREAFLDTHHKLH